MKKLLTWLTLLTTGSVVVLLVVYLVPTAAALMRADRNLARLVGGLEAIRDNTAPLGQDLPAVNAAAGTLLTGLVAVDEHLRAIAQAVQRQA
jgi:hypothetical protein